MPGPRMPHNNRMSTSNALKTSNMWSRTIGHDPYAAGADEEVSAEAQLAEAQQSRDLLELARHQNIANAGEGAGKRGGDDFSSKMFFGLKRKKKRNVGNEVDPSSANMALLDSGSSSEEEFIEQEVTIEDNNKRKSKKSSKKGNKSKERSKIPSCRKHKRSRKYDRDRRRKHSRSRSPSVSSDESRRRRRKSKKSSK